MFIEDIMHLLNIKLLLILIGLEKIELVDFKFESYEKKYAYTCYCSFIIAFV